ncbi:IclR family transcriptional regulator [Pseudomonadota bacterium AL_CKDN230030165-1A_HGKHYDSX7]
MTQIAPPLDSAPRPRERRQRVQAAETGMAVLKALARLGGRASLTALATEVNEQPSKVHRYLVSMIEAGIVVQDSGSGHYRLGLEALYIGLAAMRQADPIRVAEPALVRLREQLGVTCFIAVMGNKGPTIVRFEEPGLPVTVNVRVGSVMSLLWSATGRVFLGLQDDAQVRRLALEELDGADAASRAALDARDPLGALQREVRAAGCSIVIDTNLKGISAVSAPIFNHAGQVCGALTALGTTGGFDAAAQGPIAVALRAEAQAASRELGYPPARAA